MHHSFQHQIAILGQLIKRDIQVRYKNSYLGYFWSLGNPLLLTTVYYFVFQVVNRVAIENYILFLVSGLFVWHWISNSLSANVITLVSHRDLIKRIYFNRKLLIFSVVISEGIHFLISTPIIIGLMFYFGATPSFLLILGIPILSVGTSFFITGLGFIVSSINVFIRDLERVMQILLMVSLFLTPILYSETMIPAKLQWSIYVNPFALFIISWRKLFLEGSLPISYFMIAQVHSIVFYLVGNFIFTKLNRKFAEVL